MSLNLIDIIKERRSVKKYKAKEVSKEVLLRILEASRWAPSAHNAQPWHFIVIKDPATKHRLAEAMAKRWNNDLSKNGIQKEQRKSLVEASVKLFENAPVITIACLTMENMDEYPDNQRKKIEYIMAVQSVAAAIENVLLAAHGEGLGSCWFCAPLFCADVVRKTLKIPGQIDPQALITLGYPANKPNPSSRKLSEDIIHQDFWGNHM
jgi:coenzyme F420-0:L-glutamate ligase/coenzyme F420-1:gamma-L-glutamate ligase